MGKQDHARLKALASANNSTMAALVRKMLDDEIAKSGQGGLLPARPAPTMRQEMASMRQEMNKFASMMLWFPALLLMKPEEFQAAVQSGSADLDKLETDASEVLAAVIDKIGQTKLPKIPDTGQLRLRRAEMEI